MLASLDSTIPTYFGTPLGHWRGYHYYFEGMMYGFTWHVVKTLAAAEIPSHQFHQQWHEDARMGELMVS